MCSSRLKLIAIALMVLDHIGAIFFPDYWPLRAIGRLCLPAFCWLLVCGFSRTRSPRRYFWRLLALAVVSQPIYWFAFGPGLLNIYFGLSLALCCLVGPWWLWPFAAVAAQVLGFDYGAYLVALVALLRWYESALWWWSAWALLHLLSVWLWPLQPLAALFAFVLPSWRDRPGRSWRWAYWFYPAHIGVLACLRLVMSHQF